MGSEEQSTEMTTASPLQDLGVLILNIPARLKWWRSTDFAMTYYTPTKRHSALWVTALLPVSGTFATGHTYTHQDLLESAWYFHNISPEELGLNQAPYQLSKPWEPWLPQNHASKDEKAAMLALKRHILTHFQVAIAACARERCKKPPALRYVLNTTVFEIVEGGHREARQMRWPSENWSFERNDQYTAVMFHQPGPLKMQRMMDEMQQHVALHGVYIPKRGTGAERHHLIPSSDAAWAFIDSPNILLSLTHFGAPDVRVWSWGLGLTVGMMLLFVALAAWGLKRCLQRPTAWVLHFFWSVGSPQSWRERAGRSSGDENYQLGDLTRTFTRKMHIRVAAGCTCLRAGTSTLRRRVSRRPQYRPLRAHDIDLEDISTHGHIELGPVLNQVGRMAGVHDGGASA